MIWYDAHPMHGEGVTMYEGTRHDKDPTTFRSFEKAKRAAKARIEADLKQLKDELDVLEGLTQATCRRVRNPFW